MKKTLFFLLFLSFVSCKSKAISTGDASNNETAQKIIDGHYNNNLTFSTLYIKSNAKYEDSKQSQSVTAEIKIQKDEKILVSIRFLGITMAKALITPASVQYYEKLNGKYFEGNYIALSQWLGTDLDYSKVQNMLLGKAIDDLTKAKYNAAIVDKLYKLEAVSDKEISKDFFFESENFLIKKQEITQPSEQRKLVIDYTEYQKKDALFLPLLLNIEANQKKGKTTIEMEYKTITINEELSFPYSVPSDYERIYIN